MNYRVKSIIRIQEKADYSGSPEANEFNAATMTPLGVMIPYYWNPGKAVVGMGHGQRWAGGEASPVAIKYFLKRKLMQVD